jgi:hypothetical protein
LTRASAPTLKELVRELVRRSAPPSELGTEELARKVLGERAVPELLPLLLERTVQSARINGWVIGRPGRRWRVSRILETAPGPLHVSEIRRRLERDGDAASERKVRAALEHTEAICTAPSTYVHPGLLARWNPLLPDARRDVLALFAEDPDRQWSSREILAVLRERGVPWAAQIEEPYVLDHLLGQVEEVVGLRRSMWALRGRHERRIPIADVARRALIDAGKPLRFGELTRLVQRVRSVGKQGLIVRWPLVRLGEGQIGLGERDLGLDDAAFERLSARAVEELARPPGRIPPARLDELREECCPGVRDGSLRVLAMALAARHHGFRLDRDGRGLRRASLPRRGDRKPRIAGRRPRFRGLGKLSTTAFFDLLARAGDGRSTQEIRERLAAERDVHVPEDVVARLLRAAGWIERDGGWRPGTQTTRSTRRTR